MRADGAVISLPEIHRISRRSLQHRPCSRYLAHRFITTAEAVSGVERHPPCSCTIKSNSMYEKSFDLFSRSGSISAHAVCRAIHRQVASRALGTGQPPDRLVFEHRDHTGREHYGPFSWRSPPESHKISARTARESTWWAH